jgi:hypothetical protein
VKSALLHLNLTAFTSKVENLAPVLSAVRKMLEVIKGMSKGYYLSLEAHGKHPVPIASVSGGDY